MTIKIVTSSTQDTKMLDIVNVSLGEFLWDHVQRLFSVGDPDSVEESGWYYFKESEPLLLNGYHVDFEKQTEDCVKFSKDYRNLLSMYFNVQEDEIMSATIARYFPKNIPTLYDYPENYEGSCPSVKDAFLPVRDFYNKPN